ncbi:ArnT family glycosyltransferase [Dietzia sp.]|uniref:ArnT family glycosyltransferase n=1 Tax=Dietzia sp. TaxID=1871616 RepID=UPI002FDA2A16
MSAPVLAGDRQKQSAAERHRPNPRTAFVLFFGCTALYLAIGLYLALGVHYFQGDALSRVADTRSALWSRDPHMAALGFVFTPLPALAQLPFVALSEWFPVLTRYGLTSVLVTSLAMTGAVVQVHGIAAERPCPRWLRLTVTAAFALHPMVVYYGGNGMSEAFFLLFVLWSVRRLLRWITTDDVHDLLFAGIAIALAFLTRYDALAASGTATLLVLAVSWARSRSRSVAILDAIVLAFPTVLAFLAWTATSWLVTGVAFVQFSSVSGNTAILEASGGGSAGGLPALGFSLTEIVGLAPSIGILLVVTAVLSAKRRDAEALVLLLPLAVLAFATLTYFRGMTFPFLRFYICAIPTVVLCGILLSPRGGAFSARRAGEHAVARPDERPHRQRGLEVLAALLLVAGIPIGLYAIGEPNLSNEQHALRSIGPWGSRVGGAEQEREDRAVLATFSTEREIADMLDAKGLPEGSVLLDSMEGFPILAASRNLGQFVIPSDRDFVQILGNPARNGVRYLLTIPNSGRGATDAINRRYPTVYTNGAGVATLELEIVNTGHDRPDWRLQRVL